MTAFVLDSEAIATIRSLGGGKKGLYKRLETGLSEVFSHDHSYCQAHRKAILRKGYLELKDTHWKSLKALTRP
jgi:hypothetical protein